MNIKEIFNLKRISDLKDEQIQQIKRYDLKSVENRMVERLKSIDKIIPGTYHYDAKITQLTMTTKTLFSFPEYDEMVRSYLDIIEFIKDIFWKSLYKMPSEQEINEYNFLVSVVGASDACMTKDKLVTYNNVCFFKELYLEENYRDFYSYVKIDDSSLYEPWQCIEFFESPELAQRILNIFPFLKKEIRTFYMEATNFLCNFIWSDAKSVCYLDENEVYMEIPKEPFYQKEITRIYVEKLPEEMKEWENFVDKMKKLTGPASKGGLNLVIREWDRKNWIQRAQKRMEFEHRKKSFTTLNEKGALI